MKRLFTLLFAACTLMAAAVSCYDDSALQGEIDSLKNRVTTLEDMMKTANSNISSLKQIIQALENKVYVNSIKEISDGYEIKFSDGTTATIKNGHSPVISASKDKDIYYWTVDGEWLLDKDGQKIPVTGAAPELKIKDGRWLLSSDGGKTWTDIGQATGNPGTNGSDGDSFFKNVSWDNDYVYLTLADGVVLTLPQAYIMDILKNVQSVIYVPDYEDLKITVNSVSIKYGNNVILMDQPTEITYQILPAQYAGTIAESIRSFYSFISKDIIPLSDEWHKALKEFGINKLVAWFDVKPLKTRSGEKEEALKYGIRILDVVSADENTGEITFKVLPVNIASASFNSNGLKPLYDVASYQNNWIIPVWYYNDLIEYQNRSAFAVQLRLYHCQYNEKAKDQSVDYDNELASSYTTLYPNVMTPVELLPDVYVPDNDGNGLAKVDGDETQFLPYNVFRKDATKEEPGYRTILKGVTPVFVIDGKKISAEEADKLGYMVEDILNPIKTISYNGQTAGAVIVNDEDYIEVEMNPDASDSAREAAINDSVEGKYTFNTPFGPIECTGRVIITQDAAATYSDYDFLHLSEYTFNTKTESTPFIYKYDFPANDGSVEWWAQVSPCYYTQEFGSSADMVSFSHALADYAPDFINLSERAFNVVDSNDHVLSQEEMDQKGLEVKFVYQDQDLENKPLPDNNITEEFKKYGDLWLDKTIFLFNTNEYQYIPMKAKLYQDGKEISTRFSVPRQSYIYPSVTLDYSSFALVNWRPFKDLKASDVKYFTGNTQLFIPLSNTINLKDNRPNDVSYDVIKDGEWIIGNVSEYDAESGTYSDNGNGYVYGKSSKDAYHIPGELEFKLDFSLLPKALKKIMSVVYSDDGYNFYDESGKGMKPYLKVNLNSQVEFHGMVDISVHVELPNPWQPTLETDFTISLKSSD